MTWNPSCLDEGAGGQSARSVSIEVWEASASETSCAACRSGSATCTLLARECIELSAPTAVPDLDEALEGVTVPATSGAVCVHVIATTAAACVGFDCRGAACVDAVAYCADGLASTEGIAVGIATRQVCVDPAVPISLMHLEPCIAASAGDAGTPTDAGLSLDAGLFPPRDVGPPPDAWRRPDAAAPLDAPLPPRDGEAADGCPPVLPRCRDT